MPKKKSFNRQLGSSSMWREFKKFWHKLDHMQQISLMSFFIIALSIPLGLSLATQKALTTTKTQAQNIEYTISMPETIPPTPEASCNLKCNGRTRLNPQTCECEQSSFLRRPFINLGFPQFTIPDGE